MRSILFIGFMTTSLFFLPVEAVLEDHFKKAEGKTSVHTIENIDFIYMINLDARVEKFKRSTSQLSLYGIYPYRFSAVNGWELTLEDLQDIALKYEPGMKKDFPATSYLTADKVPTQGPMTNYGQPYFRRKMSCGMIGCLLSHLSVLQDAYDSEYETIWVLEDDILVLQDPTQIPELIDKLDRKVGKGKWDVLFTDRDMRKVRKMYERCSGWSQRPNFKPKDPERFKMSVLLDDTFRRVGARFGTHSMIIRRSGIKKILDFIKTYQVFNPYDLDMYLPEDIKLYTVLHDVVTNEAGVVSDTLEFHFTEEKDSF